MRVYVFAVCSCISLAGLAQAFDAFGIPSVPDTTFTYSRKGLKPEAPQPERPNTLKTYVIPMTPKPCLDRSPTSSSSHYYYHHYYYYYYYYYYYHHYY